jgi:hypothetical protein
MKATPPTTPPAMAPTFVDEPLDGVGVAVALALELVAFARV